MPSNWAWSTIGAVTDYIQRGKSPKYADQSSLPVINQKCIRWNELQLQHLKYVHPDQIDAWDELRHIRPGDILWNSTGTGTVGRAYLVKDADCTPPKVVDSHVTIVRAATALNPRYLFNWIKSPAVQSKIEEMCDGTTNQIELSRSAIAATAIPVAPEGEQTRIADQLDKLLARIQSCNDRLDAIPALLKRFRQAVLSAAISGELHADQSSPEEVACSDEGFPMVSLSSVMSEPLRNGKSVRDGNGLPVLRLTSLKTGGIDLSETKRGDWSGIPDTNRFLIQNGDYLVSRGNGSKELVGRGGLVYGCKEDIAFPDTMIRIRPDAARVHPSYLNYAWSSQLVRLQIEQAAKTTAGIWKVSQPDLESVRLPLPTLEEQKEIVRRVETLFKLADSIEARYKAAQTQAQRLSPLLLTKAFRGELVPQDPNDEPASALLERITVEREKAAAQPRARKSSAGRKPVRAPKENATMTKSRQDEDVQGQPYLARHLRLIGGAAPAEALFKASELPVADFYKQLAWEVANGHLRDGKTVLELGDAA